jgi:hypothetical protein
MAKKNREPTEPENGPLAPSEETDELRRRTIAPPMIAPPMSVPRALAVCIGGWLVPGVSHLVLGRWGRGLAFTASVIAMFVLGLAMQGRLYAVPPEQPLHLFAFVADVGVGIPYFVAEQFGYGVGVLSGPNYDYGTTFLWVAGLLNYLIVLDAFDISQGRKP